MANNFRTNADIKPDPKGVAEPVAIRPVCRNFEVIPIWTVINYIFDLPQRLASS